MKREEPESNPVLRTAAVVALPVGVAGSIAFLVYSGGRGVPPLLWFAMIAWILAPFAALELARRASSRASILSSTTCYVLILVVSTGSLATYAINLVRPLSAKAAFPYVIVPLCSWVLITVTVLVNWALSNRRRKADRMRPSG